jgi:hypothetical protein
MNPVPVAAGKNIKDAAVLIQPRIQVMSK